LFRWVLDVPSWLYIHNLSVALHIYLSKINFFSLIISSFRSNRFNITFNLSILIQLIKKRKFIILLSWRNHVSSLNLRETHVVHVNVEDTIWILLTSLLVSSGVVVLMFLFVVFNAVAYSTQILNLWIKNQFVLFIRIFINSHCFSLCFTKSRKSLIFVFTFFLISTLQNILHLLTKQIGHKLIIISYKF